MGLTKQQASLRIEMVDLRDLIVHSLGCICKDMQVVSNNTVEKAQYLQSFKIGYANKKVMI